MEVKRFKHRHGQHTFVLLAKRFVLPDQFITLGLHLLHLIVVLSEGTIKLGLQQGGVFSGFV
jgi:hypothetical protein